MLIAGFIFIITLLLIIFRPFGLKIGTSAVMGALVSLFLGVVSFDDTLVVLSVVWDATLTLVGIIIMSMILDEIGFFEWCALHLSKLSKQNGHLMFVYVLLFGSVVSALFANDGAVLILTPILLAKMKILQLKIKTMIAFLLAGGFISDSASLPFVFSNLTNIITANYFKIGFSQYFANMALAYVVSTVASIAVLWIVLRKDIPPKINTNLLKDPNSVIKDISIFKFSWFFIAILLCGYFVGDIYGLPVSLFALGGGVLLLIVSSRTKVIKASKIIKNAPWQIVWFSIGLYIVVYGLKNGGMSEYISNLISKAALQGEFYAVMTTGFLSAAMSAIMNNLPTNMIMNISLYGTNETLAYANIIGSNLGPKMTPFGSLATLLWLHVLEKKGVKIGFWEYSKFGILVTLPVLFVTLLALIF
ncbi:arsenic transporter [Campylobacter hyointestinalis]|uniref:arsenic transporter n=1 Tax=Campylobacter hyointestinalis TaxID=198 RepID=UPI000DCC7C8F|nr:arsenic transporter [Campylobacter hyointestinalis]RAZ56117.1 arsenical efflux pump membrane protein ArsB [Campylobacter hyointestinalis subsp. lawsonii]RAZ62880.1 arsenical efflux pump membrane protein ArsB [Campylobacter hyointestinalis subsp. lawsonii]